MTQRHPKARTLQQVIDQSPGLAQLTARLKASEQCLKAITRLIPAPMRKAVHAGPIEQSDPSSSSTRTTPPTTCWVILADNAAVAAKLRQLKPLMLQYLEKENLCIQEVRIHILPPGSGY